MRPSGPRSFAVRLDLGPVTSPDVRRAIDERAGAYDPQLSGDEAELELLLTVTAQDLWMAVLMALAAVTDAGVEALRLEVRPSAGQ